MNDSNVMREIRLDKVTVNIGVGEAGDRLLKAKKILELVTKQKPVITRARHTNRDLGIRPGMEIGCKVTLRGTSAEDFLKRAFWTRENRIAEYSFDPEGNFSFGVADYTDFEGVRYDPEIGIFGMDVTVTLKRRGGKRVSTRRLVQSRIPKHHRISQDEGREFVSSKFSVEVVE
jgi:large subunit ribosomal protein L5